MADFRLMFYNARWYDPTLGRLTSADTVVPAGVQGYDRYAYANNSPVVYNDPSGHIGCFGENADDGPQCYQKGKINNLGHNQPMGNRARYHHADLGNFQLLPGSSAYLSYAQAVQEGYSGWWQSGASAYGDQLLPGMPVNSNQVGVGAVAAFPAVFNDWALMFAPYAQRALSAYNQTVSIDYSVQYYNIPRKDGYMAATIDDLVITNSSESLVNYTISLSSASNPNIVRSGVFSAAPNEAAHASMPGSFTFMGPVSIEVHAFTSCLGLCISSNPPPPFLAGYGIFNFSP